MRRSSVETLSPRSHCCSSLERSSAKTSARRFIARSYQAVRLFDCTAGFVDESCLNAAPAVSQLFQSVRGKERGGVGRTPSLGSASYLGHGVLNDFPGRALGENGPGPIIYGSIV